MSLAVALYILDDEVAVSVRTKRQDNRGEVAISNRHYTSGFDSVDLKDCARSIVAVDGFCATCTTYDGGIDEKFVQ